MPPGIRRPHGCYYYCCQRPYLAEAEAASEAAQPIQLAASRTLAPALLAFARGLKVIEGLSKCFLVYTLHMCPRCDNTVKYLLVSRCVAAPIGSAASVRRLGSCCQYSPSMEFKSILLSTAAFAPSCPGKGASIPCACVLPSSGSDSDRACAAVIAGSEIRQSVIVHA